MAERTLESDSQTTEPVTTIDLREPSEIAEVTPDLTPDARDTELETLRQQNERLRQQVNGSSSEARRLLQEQAATNERIARLEGSLQRGAAGASPAPQETAPPPSYQRGKLKTALQKWLNGDESDLDAVEEDFGRMATIPRSAPAPEPIKHADLQALIRSELREIGTNEVVRQSVATVHPEMGDTSSPVYNTVFNTYDAYANDQTNQLMYPSDPKFNVTIYSPDGTQSKVVDARIVRVLASDVKMQMGIRGTQQASVGQTQGGRGATTSLPANRAVEAIELLTQAERDEIVSMQQQRAWPSTWPKDPKAAARHIFDGLDPAEKSRRVTEYKRGIRGGV
jgi:hypothetical protein